MATAIASGTEARLRGSSSWRSSKTTVLALGIRRRIAETASRYRHSVPSHVTTISVIPLTRNRLVCAGPRCRLGHVNNTAKIIFSLGFRRLQFYLQRFKDFSAPRPGLTWVDGSPGPKFGPKRADTCRNQLRQEGT